MIKMKSMRSAVKLVKIVEAVKRRPEPQRRKVTYFSELDVWLYDATLDNKVCVTCRRHEGKPYRGNHLRARFPYLEILDVYTIHPHTHPNCRCYLVRRTG